MPVTLSRAITVKEPEELKCEGYVSTGRLLHLIGISGLNVNFIENVLGVQHQFVNKNRTGIYWSPSQISEIRRALISHLVRYEFDDPKSPYNTLKGSDK